MGMNMGMCMSQTTKTEKKLKMEVKMEGVCKVCGAHSDIDEHGDAVWNCTWQCPVKVATELRNALEARKRKMKVQCTKCKGFCWVNQSDYFECTQCHTQYVSVYGIGGCEDYEVVVFADEVRNKIYRVYVLPEKGTGDFPVENEWNERIAKADNARERMERILNSMRKWMSCKQIYFNGSDFTGPESIGVLTQQVLMGFAYTRSLH